MTHHRTHLTTHLATTFMAAALGLAACGSSQSSPAPAATGEPATAPPPGLTCDKEIQFVCGEGAQDGCVDGKTLAHVCVTADAAATAGPPCTQKLALNCAQGQYDACLRPGMAANHVCVFEPPVQ